MKPLLDYIQQAKSNLEYAQKQAEVAKKIIPFVEKIFESGWPENWIYKLMYGQRCIWIEFVKSGLPPTDQEVRELKKSIMKYTTSVKRTFRENTGKFCWMGDFSTDFYLIEFEFCVELDPNCKVKAVEKTVMVFESVCDDE